MSLSMYQASAPVFIRQLGSVAKILEKAEAFALSSGIDPADLIEARLAPDMHPFPRQIQIASDLAKGSIARLAGVDIPSFADTETSFAELQERVAKTIAFITGLPAEKIDGSEAREIALKVRGNDITLAGQAYLLHFVMPNFFFHCTTAYLILRHKGVPLGKMDFIGGIPS